MGPASGTPTLRPWPAWRVRASAWLVLAALLAVSVASWFLVARQSDGGHMVPSLLRPTAGSMSMGGMDMAAGMGLLVFLSMWVTMMAAMMFPTVSTQVVGYWRISQRREQGPGALVLFMLSYLVVWSVAGLLAYAGYMGVLRAADTLSPRTLGVLGGGALVAAGVYQWTGAKSACLRRCRGLFEMALGFRPGLSGAVRMGTGHGLWCFGCCWALMTVLFVVGLMNLAWMGVIAAGIFVEKLAPRPDVVVKVVGATLLVAGAGLMAGVL